MFVFLKEKGKNKEYVSYNRQLELPMKCHMMGFT